MENGFEYFVKADLHRYLVEKGEMDERIPECPDVEGLWIPVAESYGADGIREFNEYPEVSLGWMMFIGMAVTEFWDRDWERYSAIEDLYLHLRDVRGFDCMDEHILEDILCLDKEAPCDIPNWNRVRLRLSEAIFPAFTSCTSLECAFSSTVWATICPRLFSPRRFP